MADLDLGAHDHTSVYSYLIFLSLIAPFMIGTENIRWMGDTRFIVGYLRGGIRHFPEATGGLNDLTPCY